MKKIKPKNLFITMTYGQAKRLELFDTTGKDDNETVEIRLTGPYKAQLTASRALKKRLILDAILAAESDLLEEKTENVGENVGGNNE